MVYTVSLDEGVKAKRRKVSQMRAESRGRSRPRIVNTPVPRSAHTNRAPRKTMRAASPSAAWGLDPFDRPFAAARDPVVATKRAGADRRIHLDGILKTMHGSTAMVNGDLYRVGDQVGGYTLQEIGNGMIVLRRAVDGTKITLKVE